MELCHELLWTDNFFKHTHTHAITMWLLANWMLCYWKVAQILFSFLFFLCTDLHDSFEKQERFNLYPLLQEHLPCLHNSVKPLVHASFPWRTQSIYYCTWYRNNCSEM